MKLPKRDAFGRFLRAPNSTAKKRTRKKKASPGLNAQTIANQASGKGAQKPTTVPVNHVALVVDCSGSMQSVWPDVIRELKNNLNTVRGESIRAGQATDITLTVFGDEVRKLYLATPIQDAKLPDYLYPNMGMTALYDAVDQTAEALEKLPDAKETNTSFLMIVITDGEENASKYANVEKMRMRIDRLQKTDRWSFAFVVPPYSKPMITQRLGLPEGNVIEWTQSAEGARYAGASITRGVTTYYTTRSAGGSSTKGFFTTDLSKVAVKDVKNNLDDIQSKVRILEVPKEMAIKEFVESKLGHYQLGSAYYELTKPEEVSPAKEILLMEKGKKAVYGGLAARNLLNMPTNLTVKVKPGNHANYNLFILSTSVNRKLVRGTKVIVRTAY